MTANFTKEMFRARPVSLEGAGRHTLKKRNKINVLDSGA
jgi:hypothetical protein